MNGFFNLDGPFYKWGSEIADVMILSILWLVCCIPIFTIGASTTALFYVFGKKVRGEDPYVFRHFFQSFKENFKQATIITIILGVMLLSSYLYVEMLLSGTALMWIKIIGMFFVIQVTFISLYIFPVLSRFEMSIKNIFISSFIFANKHFITSILCVILFAANVYVILSLSPFTLFSFGIYALLSSYLFQRIFAKNIEAAQVAKEKAAAEAAKEEEGTDEIIEEI